MTKMVDMNGIYKTVTAETNLPDNIEYGPGPEMSPDLCWQTWTDNKEGRKWERSRQSREFEWGPWKEVANSLVRDVLADK